KPMAVGVPPPKGRLPEMPSHTSTRISGNGRPTTCFWLLLVGVGPLGRGKTTTAALWKIYAGMGIVRHPEIREVRRSDFCGHYIGESGPKTNELIEKSLGRIIFMDEFYSLIERHQDGTPDTN